MALAEPELNRVRTKPPFISDHQWRLLVEFDRPWNFLHPADFRAGRAGSELGPDHDPGRWIPVTAADVLRGRLDLKRPIPDCPRSIELRDVVITTDAGIGKTKAMERLKYLFNVPGQRTIAFALTSEMLTGAKTAAELERRLVQDFENLSQCTRDQSETAIRSLLRNGRVVLLCDGLDQLDDQALSGLERLVTSYKSFGMCQLVLAGRPYALDRVKQHYPRIWESRDWRFVQLLEFTIQQQREFLGRTENGRGVTADGKPKWRIELVPAGGRSILSIPRVLEHLFDLTDDALETIQTPADVYLVSTQKLIEHAIANSKEAAKISGVDKVFQAMNLLGAIAFCLTSYMAEQRERDGEESAEGNFDKIPQGKLQRFLQFKVSPRYQPDDNARFSDDFRALSAMNEVLEHGFFDTTSAALKEIQFRSRTLQEFFCAYYLAQQAFSEHGQCQESDWAIWRTWFYLPENLATEAYYYIWQFLCDLPGGAPGTCDEESWLRAVSPLYQPTELLPDGTRTARRSSEMIYRSWWYLNQLKSKKARSLLETWQGEFASILQGGQGEEQQRAARELTESFVWIPDQKYKMGSPLEQHAMTDDWRNDWQAWIDSRPADEAQWDQYVEDKYQKYYKNPLLIGRAAKESHQATLAALREGLHQQAIGPIEAYVWPSDETPVSRWQTVPGFWISRMPTLNEWYRLFAPTHGRDQTAWYHEYYERRSETSRQPVIFVSWFDAWVFSQWCRWDSGQCRLLFENEWEAVAKLGVDAENWDWPYWWGTEFDPEKANAKTREPKPLMRTNEPTPRHANTATQTVDFDPTEQGVMDLLGNVLEWVQDLYRREYIRSGSDMEKDSANARVLRGGSWGLIPRICRCAGRRGGAPDRRFNSAGFRLSRTP